jgi:hypothetical protein
MADQTFIEKFAKAEVNRPQVEQVRQQHLDAGAESSEITDDAANWILTTVWPGDC